MWCSSRPSTYPMYGSRGSMSVGIVRGLSLCSARFSPRRANSTVVRNSASDSIDLQVPPTATVSVTDTVQGSDQVQQTVSVKKKTVRWETPVLAGAAVAGLLYYTAGLQLLTVAGFAAAVSALSGVLLLPILRTLKAQQVIRAEGPSSHQAKAGTPTMGGIALLIGALAASYFSAGATPSWIITTFAAVAMGLVGLLDDLLIIFKKNSKGLTPTAKLVGQMIVAGLTCYLTSNLAPYPPYDALPLFDVWCIYVGPLFWILAGTTMVSEANGVNLTDGLDGLAGSTVAIAFAALALALSKGFPHLVPICAAFAGACVGFLLLNRRPAAFFMGNVGSLALGAALGSVILTSKFFIPGLIVSGVFVVETLSVMLQVWYYKRTKGPDGKGKRLFLMAPIHHHFELKGMREHEVVRLFIVLGTVFAILGALQGLSSPIII